MATATSAARQATGRVPRRVRRFRTGAAHYVFEALFDDTTPVVVRMGSPAQREEMTSGLRLARRLRPLGVPLPEALAEGLDQPCPWIVIERLPGTDLGRVMHRLSQQQLRGIAARVAAAQLAAARFGSVGRYGYAPEAWAAPYTAWSAVLDANLARSRRRIASADLFGLDIVDSVASLTDALRPDLDALLAVPFLHDTTTRNVIVTPRGAFSGIVDVDDLCFGDPRYAPALTLAVLLAYGGPTGYVQAWMAEAGHVDDQIFRLYVALFLVDLMAEHGQRLNGNERTSTPAARDALTQAFTRAIAIASA